MIHHIRAKSLHPEAVPDDDEHYGPAKSAYETVFTSADKEVIVGVWNYEGEQFTRPRLGLEQGYEEILVLTDGSLEVECDGATYELRAGDAIIYDCPVGAKHLRSPEGFKGVYVVHYRRQPDPS